MDNIPSDYDEEDLSSASCGDSMSDVVPDSYDEETSCDETVSHSPTPHTQLTRRSTPGRVPFYLRFTQVISITLTLILIFSAAYVCPFFFQTKLSRDPPLRFGVQYAS